MSVRRLLLITVPVLLAAAAGFWLQLQLMPAPEQPPQIVASLAPGDLWVDARMPDSNGQYRQLFEWQGKLVVMNFWATWCPPCREEMPALQAVQNQLGQQGVQILGIALDRPDAVREFLTEIGIEYPNLLGNVAGVDISRIYGNQRGALPYTVLISREGKILEQHFGTFTEDSLRDWLFPYL